MKNFILMIFAVSFFFTGLGGLVEQIGLWKNSKEIAFISHQRNDKTEKNIHITKSFKVVREDGNPLIIKGDKKDFHFERLQINPSNQIERSFEFEHQLRLEPSKQSEEFRRLNGKNFIIIKRGDGGKIEDSKLQNPEIQPFRVLIERKNKPE